MNEYLEQAILNAINTQIRGIVVKNDSQWVIDEDEQVYYMEGNVNGIRSRWTVNKPISVEL
jgi:hypothetical protein